MVLRTARRYLRELDLAGCELSLTLVTDAAIRRLNREWRHKDKPTDVLSFPAGEPLPGAVGPRPLGDIAISLDTAARAAKQNGTELEDELRLYLAHGLLHLLGFDHHRPGEARQMAKMEARLLGSGGMLSRAGLAR